MLDGSFSLQEALTLRCRVFCEHQNLWQDLSDCVSLMTFQSWVALAPFSFRFPPTERRRTDTGRGRTKDVKAGRRKKGNRKDGEGDETRHASLAACVQRAGQKFVQPHQKPTTASWRPLVRHGSETRKVHRITLDEGLHSVYFRQLTLINELFNHKRRRFVSHAGTCFLTRTKKKSHPLRSPASVFSSVVLKCHTVRRWTARHRFHERELQHIVKMTFERVRWIPPRQRNYEKTEIAEVDPGNFFLVQRKLRTNNAFKLCGVDGLVAAIVQAFTLCLALGTKTLRYCVFGRYLEECKPYTVHNGAFPTFAHSSTRARNL